MNVCFEGYCCCDSAEWDGDTYCDAYYGRTKPVQLKDYVYYLDPGTIARVPMVFSVERHERVSGVKYFEDPDLILQCDDWSY